jgi:hypothetical protein
VVAAKAAAAAAIFAAGAIVAFATLYALGWRDRVETRAQPSVPAPARRVYTLRDGDVAVRREARVKCEASAEGGLRNLYCMRLNDLRPHVIFYDDCVHVWPVVRRSDGEGFPVAFGARPRRGCG